MPKLMMPGLAGHIGAILTKTYDLTSKYTAIKDTKKTVATKVYSLLVSHILSFT
jgi:hypothetical protein